MCIGLGLKYKKIKKVYFLIALNVILTIKLCMVINEMNIFWVDSFIKSSKSSVKRESSTPFLLIDLWLFLIFY